MVDFFAFGWTWKNPFFVVPAKETMALMSESLGLDTEEVKSISYNGTFLDMTKSGTTKT
jgi:hypothetical protein